MKTCLDAFLECASFLLSGEVCCASSAVEEKLFLSSDVTWSPSALGCPRDVCGLLERHKSGAELPSAMGR